MRRSWKRVAAFIMVAAMILSLCVLPTAAEETADVESTVSEDTQELTRNMTPEEPIKSQTEIDPANAEGADAEVIPGENDYTMSGTTLTGLSAAYINGLSAEQRQRIRLVIPESIHNVEVTAIGANAFCASKYEGCQFIWLDLSQAVHIQTIANNAFASNSKLEGTIALPNGLISIGSSAFSGDAALSGGVVLPDSLTSLGANAFYGCTGLNGELKLSQNAGFNKILSQTFLYCGFTGELIIPENITAIENSAFRINEDVAGFSGNLIIPDSVVTLGTSVFSGQSGLVSVRISSTLEKLDEGTFRYCSGLHTVMFGPGSKLKSIETSCFNEAGTDAVVVLPDGLESINGNAFYNSGFKTVYLPKGVIIGSSAFSGIDASAALICNRDDYSRLYAIGFSNKDKLCYPITVTFNDGTDTVYPQLERLYNKPMNFVEGDDRSWKADAAFRLPSPPTGSGTVTYIWSFSQGTGSKVTESSNVLGTTIYAIESPVDPIITFGEDIDKVYDGESAFMSVTASHPLAKPISEAKAGDVVFYYTWQWAVIGGSGAEAAFDKNSYEVKDVVVVPTDSYPEGYATSCSVKVQACMVNSQNKAVVFNTQTHDFKVYVRPATPRVTPIHMSEEILENGLPKLKISEGDTPGEIAWKDGQQVQDGEHQYTWTFQPTDANNYKTIIGSITYGKHPSSSGSSSGSSTTPPPKTATDKKTEGNVTTETTTTTTTNKDGSKTTETTQTATNAATGEKTEVKATETVAKDGSVTKEEVKTTTAADGAKTEEKTTATVDAKTGTGATTTVKTDESGKRTAAIVVENTKDAKEVTVSADAVKSAAKADEATMTVMTAGAEIVLDASAIAAVAEPKGDTVFISVETVKTETLPESAQEPLKDAVVVDLSIGVGDTKVSDFNGGTATISMPYTKADSSKVIAVHYVAGDGTMTRIPGVSYNEKTKRVIFSTGHFSYYAITEEAALTFTDVINSDWYYDAVLYVTEARLFNGTGSATFGPNGTMTREMLATVLYRKAGTPASNGMTQNNFTDSADISAWAQDAMAWAVREGILTGVGGNRLDPQGAVTRQQLAVILYRAAGSPEVGGTALSEFGDGGAVSQWAVNGVTWSVQNGVVTGRENGLLDPLGTASRAEVATMLMRIA